MYSLQETLRIHPSLWHPYLQRVGLQGDGGSSPPPPPPWAGSPGRDADQGPQGVWVWKLHPPVSDWVSGGLRGSESSARQPVAQAADT